MSLLVKLCGRSNGDIHLFGLWEKRFLGILNYRMFTNFSSISLVISIK